MSGCAKPLARPIATGCFISNAMNLSGSSTKVSTRSATIIYHLYRLAPVWPVDVSAGLGLNVAAAGHLETGAGKPLHPIDK